jgi:hypothetical protein
MAIARLSDGRGVEGSRAFLSRQDRLREFGQCSVPEPAFGALAASDRRQMKLSFPFPQCGLEPIDHGCPIPKIVFPDTKNPPSLPFEKPSDSLIALNISIDLGSPIQLSRSGMTHVFRATVPIATIDEHHQTVLGKNKVRLADDFSGLYSPPL